MLILSVPDCSKPKFYRTHIILVKSNLINTSKAISLWCPPLFDTAHIVSTLQYIFFNRKEFFNNKIELIWKAPKKHSHQIVVIPLNKKGIQDNKKKSYTVSIDFHDYSCDEIKSVIKNIFWGENVDESENACCHN